MPVGVLALQGSFNEHIAALRRIGVKGLEIRKAEQLENVDALIIPGGESTTMAKLAHYHNLFPALRQFVSSGKPVWGTCAGLIFLADRATGQKSGGQDLIGGLDCTVHRNFFGSQVQSFETELPVPKLAEMEGGPGSCRAVFIRAPAIIEAGPEVEVLADCPVVSEKTTSTSAGNNAEFNCEWSQLTQERQASQDRVIVAVRQGNILATAFHPELTSDPRWHTYFLKMRKENGEQNSQVVSISEASLEKQHEKKHIDLPIIE